MFRNLVILAAAMTAFTLGVTATRSAAEETGRAHAASIEAVPQVSKSEVAVILPIHR